LIIRRISPSVFCHTFRFLSRAMASVSSPWKATRSCSHVFSEVEVWRMTGAEVAERASRAAGVSAAGRGVGGCEENE
jgi:hypothetical protein